MRALIIASVSLETVTSPSKTWDKFFHQILAAFAVAAPCQPALFDDLIQ